MCFRGKHVRRADIAAGDKVFAYQDVTLANLMQGKS